MDCLTHSQKNVTYNIALESTTYAICNVTLDVTTSRTNVTDCLGLLPKRELVHEVPKKGTVFIYIGLWIRTQTQKAPRFLGRLDF